MGKQWKSEEQLKADIFGIYSCYLNEPSSDRRQVHFAQICGSVISWCTDYLNIKAKEMGEEIFHSIQRLVKDNNAKVPKDKDGFLKYLRATLENVKKEYYCKIRSKETDDIKISKETRKKWKMVKEIITTKESNLGGKLTENERWQYISEWFSMAEYTELMNLKNTGSLEDYMEGPPTDPHDELLKKLRMQCLKDALDLALQRTQDRSRECCRSLFTAYCIDKLVDFEVLVPLLDREILEAHQKDREKPKQYKIYLKYYPETKKAVAEVRATQMSKGFLEKLKTALLEKNQ
jgi:hypothetical protein